MSGGTTQKGANLKQEEDISQSQDDGELSHLPETLNSPSGGNRKVPKNCWKKRRLLPWRDGRRGGDEPFGRTDLPRGHRRGGGRMSVSDNANRKNGAETERLLSHKGPKEGKALKGTREDEGTDRTTPDEDSRETGNNDQQQHRDYW
uniref:Uncharacterized protein n=1 Tax=Globodera pallida TaxID=36090 RepID=A0A183CJH1_GLOPA